jgi:hypothetical protein
VQERVVQDIPNIHCIVKRQTGPSQPDVLHNVFRHNVFRHNAFLHDAFRHNVFLYDAFGHGLPAPLAILKD